jgi:N-acetyl-anhydromuramyl-L-alanine amidase AmpD
MRTISFIVLHCSLVFPWQRSSAEDIDNWHKQRVTKDGQHWKGIGYHLVVRRDGSVEKGRPIEEQGAHCYPHNRHSIGICYEGGLNEAGEPDDTRTPEQKKALLKLLEEFHQRFPKALIVGHRDLAPGRKCPCFDAVSEYRDLQPK